jgi:integrase
LGAAWDEVDTEAGIWRIPGERMKDCEAHTVFLSLRTAEIAETMCEHQASPFMFPSATREANVQHGDADAVAPHGLRWMRRPVPL